MWQTRLVSQVSTETSKELSSIKSEIKCNIYTYLYIHKHIYTLISDPVCPRTVSHCVSALWRLSDLLLPAHVFKEQRISRSQVCNNATELYYAKALWPYGHSVCVRCSRSTNRTNAICSDSSSSRDTCLLKCTHTQHQRYHLQHSSNIIKGESIRHPAAS